MPATPAHAARTYDRVHLPRQGYQDNFRSAASSRIAPLVNQCVEVESPVHQDRVMQLVAATFGIARVGRLVREQLEQAIRLAGVQRRGEFLWRNDMDTPPVRGGALDGWVRSIDEVAPEEIAEASLCILRSAFSIGRSELIVEAAAVIPGPRTAGEVEQNASLMRAEIPGGLWAELRGAGLLPENAPTPER